MRNPHPYWLFKDPTGPNSCSKFGVGNGPTGFDMLYPPLQGEVWTVGKGSPLYTVFFDFYLAAKNGLWDWNISISRNEPFQSWLG